MIQVHIDPRLAAEGMMVAAIVATPAEPDAAGQTAYRRLFDDTLSELRAREPTLGTSPTIIALRLLHARYGGRSKRVELPQLKLAQNILQGKLKSISPFVDVYNLWSARLGLSIGAFDVDRIQGSVALRVTTGNEQFSPIGAKESKIVEAGAFAYIDEADEVLCWLDVRQGEPTKLTPSTRRALVIIEGIRPLAEDELRAFGAQIAASLLETGAASAATLLDRP